MSEPPHETDSKSILPEEPIHQIVGPIARFLHVEAASGVILLLAAVTALVLANSPWSEAFLGFWETKLTLNLGLFQFSHSLHHLVNDGLMAIFFFVIGLEVKRELVIGELREFRRAALPIVAAIGGMVFPAGVYLALQWGQPGQRGWGIPMATDIAFVVGCMSVLGPRVPHSLRVMVLSLAIADDIGAILVIAVGYTEGISLSWLIAGFVGIAVIAGLARLGMRSFPVYALISVVVWYAFHESGVHATIAGVILGLMVPATSYLSTTSFGRAIQRADDLIHGDWESVTHRAEKVRRLQRATRETIPPLEYLESMLHPWVGFVIMPIFALANAGVPFEMSKLGSSVAIAVLLGLVVGKPVGIVVSSWLAVKSGLTELPAGVTFGMITGAGCLAGIGFAMALFIAGLACEASILDAAKIGVLVGSTLSAVFGMALLHQLLPKSSARSNGR